MKKLRLNVEQLEVETFSIQAPGGEPGTVRGQEITARCSDWMEECTDRTCGGYTCDGPSCPALSCDDCGSYYCVTDYASCGQGSCVDTCTTCNEYGCGSCGY